MAEFPWAAALEKGSIFAVTIVLLYLLVDAYKQLGAQRDVISKLSETMLTKFESISGGLTNACITLNGGLERVLEAIKNRDSQTQMLIAEMNASQKLITENATRLERLLSRGEKA